MDALIGLMLVLSFLGTLDWSALKKRRAATRETDYDLVYSTLPSRAE